MRKLRNSIIPIALICFMAVAADDMRGEKKPVKADFTKRKRIEAPVKNLVELKTNTKLDVTKGAVIEIGTKRLVAGTLKLPQRAKADATKYDIVELPARALVSGSASGTPVQKTTNTTNIVGTDKPRNPKVSPGKVRWHGDFATACEASRKSGNPVLLFQMMGNLDDRFC